MWGERFPATFRTYTNVNVVILKSLNRSRGINIIFIIIFEKFPARLRGVYVRNRVERRKW